jgi:integrase
MGNDPEMKPSKGGRKVPLTQKGTVPVRWVPARKRWLLTTQVNGQKRRAFFRVEDDALRAWSRHCATVERHGREAAKYDVAAHREYEEAKRLAEGADLRDVAREWMLTRPRDRFVTVAAAVEEYQVAKRKLKLSEVHLRTLKSYFVQFTRVFGSKFLGGGVSAKDILSWLLTAKAPRTVWNKRDALVAFFDWADRQGYGKSPMGAIARCDLPRVPTLPKEFLQLDEARHFMGFMAARFPQFTAAVALRLFSGIRGAEVGRLKWEWVDIRDRVLYLPGFVRDGARVDRVTKTGDFWPLRGLPANLWPWLSRFREAGDVNGFVRSPSSERWHSIYSLWVEAAGRDDGWPKNGLRHTFCVMLVSLHGDAGKVANWSRHKSPAQLYKSYVTWLVAKSQAREFCSILPPV